MKYIVEHFGDSTSMHSFQIFYLFLLIIMCYSFYLCYLKLFGNLHTTIIICNFCIRNWFKEMTLFFTFFVLFVLFSDTYGFSYGILVRYGSGVSPVMCILYA